MITGLSSLFRWLCGQSWGTKWKVTSFLSVCDSLLLLLFMCVKKRVFTYSQYYLLLLLILSHWLHGSITLHFLGIVTIPTLKPTLKLLAFPHLLYLWPLFFSTSVPFLFAVWDTVLVRIIQIPLLSSSHTNIHSLVLYLVILYYSILNYSRIQYSRMSVWRLTNKTYSTLPSPSKTYLLLVLNQKLLLWDLRHNSF